MKEIKEQIERFRDADPAEPSDNYQWLQEAADTMERMLAVVEATRALEYLYKTPRIREALAALEEDDG